MPAVVALKERGSVSAGELVAYCRGKRADFKVPRTIEFVDELPRTPTGKIQKHLLQELFPGPAPE